MNSPITIMKFGGTSLANAGAFESVARIVRKQVSSGDRVVVVVSAMSGVTNALATIPDFVTTGRAQAALELVNDIFNRHLRVAQYFLSSARLSSYESTLANTRSEVEELLRFIRVAAAGEKLERLDSLLSYGEQLSARLFTEIVSDSDFCANYVDATTCIITEDVPGGANPLMDQTIINTRRQIGPIIDAGCLPILGGFISATHDGKPTTLGRNGSDYTASLIGVALRANEIQIWTDVAGVLTADPRLVRNALTVEHLSYAEASELSSFGAKVVFPEAIHCAAREDIRLRICSSHAPQESSTLISSNKSRNPGTVKSIALKTGLMLVRLSSYESLLTSKLFDTFINQHKDIELVDISKHSVSILMSSEDAFLLVEVLQDFGSIETVAGRALINVVGEGLSDTSGSAARIFSALNDVKVDLITQGRRSSSLGFVVAQAESAEIVQRLHGLFFESSEADHVQFDETQLILSQASAGAPNFDQLRQGDI